MSCPAADAEAAEQRQRDMQAEYAVPGFFDDKSPADLERLRETERALAAEIDSLMLQWESLERESAELEAL